MTMSREEFEHQLGTVLRHHGAGTTADLTDELVAYWNGSGLSYVLLRENPAGAVREKFSMNDAHWSNWRSWLEAWIESPTFSIRPEVHSWLLEDPPDDSKR